MGGEERLDLGLDPLRQHPPGTLAQHGQQRIGVTPAPGPGKATTLSSSMAYPSW